MKKFLLIILAASGLTVLSCSQSRQDDRQAGIYADRIEKSEAVSAEEYSEMVSFYCEALDRSLERLKPYHEAHVAAIAGGDTARVAQTERELNEQTDAVAKDSHNIKRLGSQLFSKMGTMPDTTRHRLLSHLAGIYDQYSN